MKNYFLTFIIIIIFLIGFIACDNDNNITNNNNSNTVTVIGTGNVVSDTVTLAAFHSVRNLASFDIDITKGNPQQVILKAQQNILDVVTYQVNNNELNLGIQNNVSIQTSLGLKAEIIIPEITRVGIIGAGDFNLSGGQEDVLYIDITGAGNVMAYNLDVDTCYITTTGVGNCYVKVNNLLNITITGVGNVYYKGSPSIHSTITGVGSVIDSH
jgi:hypothetical protein